MEEEYSSIFKSLTEPKYKSLILFIACITLPGYIYLFQINPELVTDKDFLNILPLIIFYSLPQYIVVRLIIQRHLPLNRQKLEKSRSKIAIIEASVQTNEFNRSQLSLNASTISLLRESLGKKVTKKEQDLLEKALSTVNEVNKLNEKSSKLIKDSIDIAQQTNRLLDEEEAEIDSKIQLAILAILLNVGLYAKVNTYLNTTHIIHIDKINNPILNLYLEAYALFIIFELLTLLYTSVENYIRKKRIRGLL